MISIVGVAVQITALRRTAKQQERSARLSAAATYAARIFDAAAAGGSPHDQSQAMAVQREILTQIAKDLRETGMTLSVPEEWPLKR